MALRLLAIEPQASTPNLAFGEHVETAGPPDHVEVARGRSTHTTVGIVYPSG
jgi:hypothetical protein